MVVRASEAFAFSGDSRMSKTYRPWNPDQDWLLPPSPREWLPEGDLVYFILDVVKTLDLSKITRRDGAVTESADLVEAPTGPRSVATGASPWKSGRIRGCSPGRGVGE